MDSILFLMLVVVMNLVASSDAKKLFKITDHHRQHTTTVAAESLDELLQKGMQKLRLRPYIRVVFDEDGYGIDHEESFLALSDKEKLMLLASGQEWGSRESRHEWGEDYRHKREHGNFGGRHYHESDWQGSNSDRSVQVYDPRQGGQSGPEFLCMAGPIAVGVGAMFFGPAGWTVAAKMLLGAASAQSTWYLQGCNK